MSLKTIGQDEELEERLRFETLITDLSSKFAGLPADDVDCQILAAERRICEALSFDLAGLWQLSDEGGKHFTLSHFFRTDEGLQPIEPMDSRECFPWCQQQMLAGRTVILSSMGELPAEAAVDLENSRHFGIKSNLTIPLSVGGKLPVGALGFNTTRAERNWPDELVKRLQLIAQIFANALARKQAEAEARELRDNLTHLTRVNTVSALSGSLAHELNQPLSVILCNAQAAQDLLDQEPPDIAEVQAILSDIVAADLRAGEVIERLRAMLRSGHLSLQPLQLNQVIEQVIRLTKSDLLGRGVAAVCELDRDLPPITGDRVQLEQLVLNLVLNGADAMAANSPGTRRLHIRTMLREGRALTSIRDEGCGLPADVERIFRPFYTTKAQGLGLGLTICRSIVGAHGGKLWASPHSERGAVFHFELPLAGPKDKP